MTKELKKPFGWIFAISQIQEIQNDHVFITVFKQIYSQNKPAVGNSASINTVTRLSLLRPVYHCFHLQI